MTDSMRAVTLRDLPEDTLAHLDQQQGVTRLPNRICHALETPLSTRSADAVPASLVALNVQKTVKNALKHDPCCFVILVLVRHMKQGFDDKASIRMPSV